MDRPSIRLRQVWAIRAANGQWLVQDYAISPQSRETRYSLEIKNLCLADHTSVLVWPSKEDAEAWAIGTLFENKIFAEEFADKGLHGSLWRG